MLIVKNCWGTPVPGAERTSKPRSFSSACKNLKGQHRNQRRSQKFDLGGYKLHDIEFVLGQGDKTTT